MIIGVVAVAAGYGLAMLYLWYSASEGMDRIAAMARPYALLKWDSVSANVGGSIAVDNLRVKPRGIDDEITAQRVIVRGTGIKALSDLVRRVRSGDLPKSLELSAEGVRLPVDGPLYRALQRRSGGRLWGTPLDDVACDGNASLETRVLDALDVRNLRMHLDVRVNLRRAARRMAVFLNMAVQGVAATSVDAYFKVEPQDSGEEYGLPTGSSAKVVGLQIHYADQGFNESRNYVCAAERDIPVDQFLSDHVAAVQTLYAHGGAPLPDALVARYREYATYGGDLRLTLEPAAPMAISRLATLDRQGFIDRLHPALVINGRSVNLAPARWFPPTAVAATAGTPETPSAPGDRKPRSPTFRALQPADLISHLGDTVRVTTSAGKTYTGVLAQADDRAVVVREAMKGGSVGYTVAMSDIDEAQVLR